jgi:glycosyltransferase involved in cell wall biosynthesis
MKILFIGSINQLKPPNGGEEFKNTLLINRLKKSSKIELNIIDTHSWRRNPFVFLKIMYYLLFNSSDKIIFSASTLSVYRLLYFIKFFRKNIMSKIIYFVVGGWFQKAINDKIIKQEVYLNINTIIVQGKYIMKQLSKSQLQNIKVIPNFKNFDINLHLRQKDTSIFKFVFIGRISKSKGILEILEATRILKIQNPDLIFSVDFYGPKEDLIEFPEDLPIFYKGYLDIMNNQIESYKTLSEYSGMLFPTYWQGEGFPGVIIDAYIAGLPIIATDWNMNKEVIEDGVTGLIVPIKDASALSKAMLKLMQNPDLVKNMSENSLKMAKDFHIDTIWPDLEKLIYS